MKKELEQQLYKMYPLLFSEKDLGMAHTCLFYGIECGDGWFPLIKSLCHAIQSHLNSQKDRIKWNTDWNNMLLAAQIHNDFSLFEEYYKRYTSERREHQRAHIMALLPRSVEKETLQVIVQQVKQKFGTLRFYYNGGDDYISGLVSMAEIYSAKVCEQCSSPAILNKSGWIRALCNKCRTEKENNDYTI